jgi:hypothetical protein
VRRWIIGIAAVLLLALGGWLWASPYWTLSQLKTAANAGDFAALSTHVDYPAVRESLKAQLRARSTRLKAGSALEELGAGLLQRLSDPLVDTVVTPEGMQMVFATRAVAGTARPQAQPVALKAADMRMRRTGITSFELRPGDNRGGALRFRLEGLRWKLAAVELPETLPL